MESARRARVLTAPVTIDGELRPDEWPDDPDSTLRIDHAEQCLPERRARWKGPGDASLVARVAVDDQALWLGISVTDDVAFPAEEPWSGGDCLELFLHAASVRPVPAPSDTIAESYGDDDWQIFLMPGNPNLHWGVARHGASAPFTDGGLRGVRMASTRRAGGSYDLEFKVPLSNFPGLARDDAHSIGFALALNDVDRLVPDATAPGGLSPDPATYLAFGRGPELARRPSSFGRLDLPARPRIDVANEVDDRPSSWPLIVSSLAALGLVLALVGPGSRRLARVGVRPKAVLLGLDLVLAGFLATTASCQRSGAEKAATTRLEAAYRDARDIADEAFDLGVLDSGDGSTRARVLRRLLAGEAVPCVPPVGAHEFVLLSPLPTDARAADERILLAPNGVEEWPLPEPVESKALRVRFGPAPSATPGRAEPTARRLLGVLRVTSRDGAEEDLKIDGDSIGDLTVVLPRARANELVRLRWTHAEGAPRLILRSIVAVKSDGTAVPIVLAGRTDDRVPILTRPGVRPGGTATFLGSVLAPGAEITVPLRPLPRADRLQLVVAVERPFPATRHGLPVAEVEVSYTAGPPTVTRLVNGDDVDEERLDQAIRHSTDMRSRIAYRWTDAAGVPRHNDLAVVPVDYGRQASSLRIKNLGSATASQGTGALSILAATLTVPASDGAGGRLGVSSEEGSGRERARLKAPEAFRGLLGEGGTDDVRVVATVGRTPTSLSLSTPLPEAVALRARRTATALLTCFVLAAFLAVLLLVDALGVLRRLSTRLVLGVLAAALLPVAATVILVDRRLSTRLESEREARVRGWLATAKGAFVSTPRQEAQVGAQVLLQLATSLEGRSDPTRVRDQVGVYRRQGIVGGASAGVLVKGREIGTIAVEPEAEGARIDGAAFLASQADAPGLYASPWDGLLLAATARSAGIEDWRKVVLGVRVDDAFLAERATGAGLDPETETAVLTRTGEVAGTSGPRAGALGRALADRFAEWTNPSASRGSIVLREFPTADGARLVIIEPLASAQSPDAPAAWLAVGLARRGLDDDIASLRAELVGLGLAAAVLVACVAATLARRIAGPVRDLVGVTEAVRRGEFDVPVPTPGGDEVGDLALAFDQMRRELKHRVGDLAFLRRTQDAVAESLDLGRTAERGLDAFRERFHPDAASLLVALSPTGPLVVRAESGRATPATDRPVDARPGGFLAATLLSSEPIVVSDRASDLRVTAENPAAVRWLDDRNAFVAVPLRAGGETQGIALLSFAGATSLPSADERELLGPLGGVVASALHNARLYRLAALDEASGLPGATAFESALRREVEAALAGGPAAIVLRVGLDNLERTSMRRSVESSRALLRASADALRSVLGGRVQAGRLREDEFAVRAPGLTREEAMALASTIRERIASVEVKTDDEGESLRTAVSVGVARCPDDARSVEFLLDAAGRALASARRDGGDRAVDVHRVDASLVSVPPFEDGAVFRTERMVRLLETARRGARTDSTVMLTGETGVGKEVLADLIHRRSGRSQKAFVKVNTAAFPESLLESELFGHEKGAFTGADRRREGRFELADGGTLFLDEVGEMSLQAQVRLLRVLAEGQFTRLGGQKPVDVDVRVIAATNQDLEKAVAGGRFREDLYYRLNVLRIEIPPLRERREEIPSLVDHFLAEARRRIGRGPIRLSPQAMDALYRHPWPGNVRELRNAIERAAVMADGEVAEPEHLRIDPPRAPSHGTASPHAVAAPLDDLNERQRKILEYLAANGRCTNRHYIEMTGASERTGLRDLQELMSKGKIVREGKRRGAVYRLP